MQLHTMQLQTADGITVDEWLGEVSGRRYRRRVISRVAGATALGAAILIALVSISTNRGDAGWSASKSGAASVYISNASAGGADVAGSGIERVTTAAYFAPHQQIAVFGAGDARVATADARGRIRFSVDLGKQTADSHIATRAHLVFLPVPRR